MEVIHSVIAPALYSLLVSLPPLLVQSLPSTPHPHPSRHPSVAPPLPSPSRFTANSCSFSPSLLLLLLLSFSFSPPCPCPSTHRLPRKTSPYKLEGSPPPLDTLPLVTLHSNTRTPHVLCKPRSFSIACSPIPTGASNRTVWAPHQLHKTQCVALYVTSHYKYVHSYFNVFSCFGI